MKLLENLKKFKKISAEDKEEIRKIKNEKKLESKRNKQNSFQSAELRKAQGILEKINQLEKGIKNLTDDQLKGKTKIFQTRLNNGESLDDIANEAFAVAREATFRVLHKRPYDVQMIGGLILHFGSVAEMKTGEGKTITSIAPIYLNALNGNGVIVSTVNEYLAERDALEMGEVFNWLGLSVGINKAEASKHEKQKAYNCDITYSIHSELGFDYLRDNMVNHIDERVQRNLSFCLIDEVDSILIDEAKTPLIISGGDEIDSNLYLSVDKFVKNLKSNEYYIDHESQSISLTTLGVNQACHFFKLTNLYLLENSEIIHRIQNALRANFIMKKDYEYVILEGKLELVDVFTGRIMEGRSYSEGLQQAIQAKEGLEIDPETTTLATVTYQNFFRMFQKLCGMTGTGKTEEQEFLDIYNMRVTVVPTNKPIIRKDHEDQIYLSNEAKLKAIVSKIKEIYEKGQPILVGTSQVDESEELHNHLLKENIPHLVLNAKQNKAEAEIISKAGQIKSVTIATNIAGRGTDIKLGEGAKELGGLFVIGTSKAESRRIDNQLKGRSGRQGDVGESIFYLSIDDSLIKRFSVQDKWKENFAEFGENKITGNQIIKAFERAQSKIEGFNYDSRKSVLNFDDVIRQQRELTYSQRNIILENNNVTKIVENIFFVAAKNLIFNKNILSSSGLIDYRLLTKLLNDHYFVHLDFKIDENELKVVSLNELPNYLSATFNQNYFSLRKQLLDLISLNAIEIKEKSSILSSLDHQWKMHINIMDKLRSSSHVVQYSQKNPYQVYTEEGTNKFNEMISEIAIVASQKLMIELSFLYKIRKNGTSLNNDFETIIFEQNQYLSSTVKFRGESYELGFEMPLSKFNDLKKQIKELEDNENSNLNQFGELIMKTMNILPENNIQSELIKLDITNSKI